MGSLYRRAGNIKAAEIAYLVALSENSDDLIAMSNLARLYDTTGKVALAEYYENKAHKYRMQNPYFLYGLAQSAFSDGDYLLAAEHAKASIDRYNKEHRFYFLLGAIYEKMGERKLAGVNFKKALDLSDDREQQARYRNKMDRLAAVSS